MLSSKKRNLRTRSHKPVDNSAAQISRINELTRAGRANWLGLLAYLAFTFITVLGVQDADFFIPWRETQLPLINVSIPTFSFFYFAPALATVLYVYLHLHVRKVTEALAETTATVKSEPIEEYLTPWLLNDFVLRRRGDGAVKTRTLDSLGDLATVCLIWLSGPFVTGWFWVRSWPAHDQIMSLLLAGSFGLCVLTGHKSYAWMWKKLGQHKVDNRLVKTILKMGKTHIRVFCVFLVLVSWARTEGGFTGPPWGDEISSFIDEKTKFNSPTWLTYDPPIWMRLTALMASTDLSNINFVELPPDARDPLTSRKIFRYDWCKRAGVETRICGGYPSFGIAAPPYQDEMRLAWCGQENAEQNFNPETCRAFFADLDRLFYEEWWALRFSQLRVLQRTDFSGADLRRTDLSNSFLAGVNFIEAQMEGADLSFAQIERAFFNRAQMEGVSLTKAQMEGAKFWGAQLEGASFYEAQMEATVLIDAQMNGVSISDALMEKAVIAGAQLEGAYIWNVEMEGIILRNAQMNGIRLRNSRMGGADLRNVQMNGAELTDMQMGGVVLIGAEMRSVDWARTVFSGSVVHSADLRGAKSFDQEQLDLVIGNKYTLLPIGRHVWSCWVKPPEGFENMVSHVSGIYVSMANVGDNWWNPERVRADWLCPEGTEPQKTGTELGLDEDPPWLQ